jgi:hypothetical protein
MTRKRPNVRHVGTAPAALPSIVTVRVPLKFTIRGGRKTIIGTVGKAHTPPRTRFDDSVTRAFARAYRWKQKLEDGTYATVGELAKPEHINESYITRLLRLNLLAPDIVEAALNGRGNFTVQGISRSISSDWEEQRALLGILMKPLSGAANAGIVNP